MSISRLSEENVELRREMINLGNQSIEEKNYSGIDIIQNTMVRGGGV